MLTVMLFVMSGWAGYLIGDQKPLREEQNIHESGITFVITSKRDRNR
ncbi:hypothetical protein BTS2_0518 [Bacillus sp. TS-2]|nr:hypothetical protein BTS2_0518 [Bacillus sp. TS-2]